MLNVKLQKEVEEAAKKQFAQTFLHNMKDIQASSFESMLNYSNAITFVGYAGIFAVWTLTKEQLNFFWSGIVGILLIISIGAFVSFEIYKMVKISLIQIKFVKEIQKSPEPDNIIRLQQGMQDEQKTLHQCMVSIWLVCFLTSVLTGLASGTILLGALIQSVIAVK